jgi:hypothetical protein
MLLNPSVMMLMVLRVAAKGPSAREGCRAKGESGMIPYRKSYPGDIADVLKQLPGFYII